jgi:hypothetical protein
MQRAVPNNVSSEAFFYKNIRKSELAAVTMFFILVKT